VSDGAPGSGTAAGLRGALARAGAATIELVRTRIELASLEFAEQREIAKRSVVLAVVSGVFLGFAVMSASALVVVALWDTHRIAAIAGVTAFHALVGIAALLRLRAAQRAAPPPFAATLAELERDRQWLASGLRDGTGGPR
jgi:uncharacterized membrane protein YqjE